MLNVDRAEKLAVQMMHPDCLDGSKDDNLYIEAKERLTKWEFWGF